MKYNRDLMVAKEAALIGKEVINDFRRSKLNIREKGFHDLVTDADIEAEKAVLGRIKESFPDDSILAEESASDAALTDERTWIVDPIDGTTNFAHDFPIYCVSVALWEKKRPLVGVVVEVNRGEVFSAVRGEGAWLNDQPIQVANTQAVKNGFISTGFPYNDLSLVDPYLQLLKELMRDLQGIRRPGAASFDLCCVACGRFDAFFEYALNIWDVAAAALIIREAGGIVTDWNGGDNWPFGQRIVAGNQHIHGYLLENIQRMIPEEQRNSVHSLK